MSLLGKRKGAREMMTWLGENIGTLVALVGMVLILRVWWRLRQDPQAYQKDDDCACLNCKPYLWRD